MPSTIEVKSCLVEDPPVQVRRSKLDIVLNVLSAVKGGVDKPTRIMYAANLSWRPIQKILASMVEQGLLEEVTETGSKRSKRRYEITEKGVDVLRYFDNAKNLIDLEILTKS
jgi:predicted transcriptional regulator